MIAISIYSETSKHTEPVINWLDANRDTLYKVAACVNAIGTFALTFLYVSGLFLVGIERIAAELATREDVRTKVAIAALQFVSVVAFWFATQVEICNEIIEAVRVGYAMAIDLFADAFAVSFEDAIAASIYF